MNMLVPRSGMSDLLPQLFAKAAGAGYRGMECGAPDESEEAQFRMLLREHRCDCMAQIHSAGDDLIADFRRNAERGFLRA